jgi:hypothetical protein
MDIRLSLKPYKQCKKITKIQIFLKSQTFKMVVTKQQSPGQYHHHCPTGTQSYYHQL